MLPPPPRSTLFPYTTLFRSIDEGVVWPVYKLPPLRQILLAPFTLAGGMRVRPRCAKGKPFIPRETPVHRRPLRSEEHTSELQSQSNLVCRLLLEKKKKKNTL